MAGKYPSVAVIDSGLASGRLSGPVRLGVNLSGEGAAEDVGDGAATEA